MSAQPELLSDHVLEPVEGWRTWELERDGGRLRLASPLVEAAWPTGDALAATCRRHAAHRAPAEQCSCGIYAVSSREDVGTVRTRVSVVGSVALWGRVVEHEKGYRGELAYPQRLRLVCAACLESDGLFTAPEAVVDDHGRLRALCGLHVWSVEQAGPPLDRAPAADVESELLDRYQVELLPLEGIPQRTASRRTRARPAATWRHDLWEFIVSATLWILLISVVAGVARSRPTPLDPVPTPTVSAPHEAAATHVPVAAPLPDPAFGKHSARQNAARRAETEDPHVPVSAPA